jgi:hypothetical protein
VRTTTEATCVCEWVCVVLKGLCHVKFVFARVAAVAMRAIGAVCVSATGIVAARTKPQHTLECVLFVALVGKPLGYPGMAFSALCRSGQIMVAGGFNYRSHRQYADTTEPVHETRSSDSDPSATPWCCADHVHCAAFVRASVLAMGHAFTAYVAWQ